jgi:hypothetical protein
MSDFNTRGKLPFTIVSSSVNTGYAAELTASVGYNIDIVNKHKDEYGQTKDAAAQGPFTNQHVGGNQHRHVPLNAGNDDATNRSEAYIISSSAGSIKVYGPDINGLDKPRSLLTRDNTAKSPVNIKNIQTSGNIAGNFEYNYQVVQSVGRRTTNNLINDGFEASGSLTTKFVSGSHEIYTLPNITNNSKSIFVERFNAPGGKEESSRGALDREGEEFSPNNSLTTRNIKVRQPYYNQLTKHNSKIITNDSTFLTDINGLKFSEFCDFSFNVTTIYFNDDGTVLYLNTSTSIKQYTLKLPYVLDNPTFTGEYLVTSQYSQISYDGLTIYVYRAGRIYIYSLGVAWDITTATYTGNNSTYSGVTGFFLKNDGTKLYTVTTLPSEIKQYDLATPWDTTSDTLEYRYKIPSGYRSLGISNDGFEVYINNSSQKKLAQLIAKDAWNVSTLSLISEIDLYGESSVNNVIISFNKQKLFLLDSNLDRITSYDCALEIKENNINKNSLRKLQQISSSFITSSVNDNFWVQHAIPRTDLRYKWIAESVSSSQQPIEYQSYALPYSTGSLYNSNGAYTDISFEQTGPFGDHLGISGAIDKDEMFTSNYTNTMYRDRKSLEFDSGQYVDISNISSEISGKDFTISFWVKIPESGFNDFGGYDFLSYSGSFGENEISFFYNSTFPMTYWYLTTDVPTSITDTAEIYNLRGTYNDSLWHLLTIVTTNERSYSGTSRESQNLFRNRVYVDGGLVHETIQNNLFFDITKIIIGAGVDSGVGTWSGVVIDDISVWNRALSEEEALETYRISKSSYGERPKKYSEHRYNNISTLQPIHVYSSIVDKTNTFLFDEVGDKNATLAGFNSSNITPQNTGIISYSTYFNGPYQGASWKSIRNNEHPVTRKLTTKNTNIVSVRIPEGAKKVKRVVRGIPVTFQLPGSRKQGQLLNVKESPVYINNKPLKHRFILKDSQDQNIAIETIHTYGNNLQYFANQQLNDTLGLLKTDRQMYDVLYDYYSGETEEIENPIQKLVGFTYNETIYPKNGQGLLKASRQRTDYITDQPGYSIDGYDRQLGTQRVFWRDNQEDRMRTRRTYITSLGDQVESLYDLPFQTPSVAALEYVSESTNLEHYSTNIIGDILPLSPRTGSFIDMCYSDSAELNSSQYYAFINWGTIFIANVYFHVLFPASQVPELYFFKNTSNTSRDRLNVVLTSSLFPDQNTSDPSSLRVKPGFIFEHPSSITSDLSSPVIEQQVYDTFTHDLGLNRLTEKISGKNPWYDSYEDYYVDIKNLSNDKLVSYSKVPEFNISKHVSSLVAEYGGDATKITLDDYNDNLQFAYRETIDRENKDICEEDTIKIVVDGVKKLLPYNGFYPQDRSIQLVNYLKQSWIDTDAIGGGLLLTGSYGRSIVTDTNDRLVQYLKESAFLEPLYAPGIFYNLIKSGIAVDWSIFTGSLPTGSYLIPLTEKPQFSVSFESLLNLKDFEISSSLLSAENRYIKHSEITQPWDSNEYVTATSSSFQGFFEKLKEGSPIYTLSINNFLAESINFFLKDSSLNTFISKPDSDFATLDSNKTYYMDVVLKKNDIIMCEAHSSSLADSFGRMSGRYFGPSFWTGSVADESRIKNNRLLAETLRDPGYCTYTPPYYYGDSVARISFKPDTTRKYSLDEIFADMQIENFNTSFINNSVYPSGTLYSSFVMPIESSVTIKGEIEQREQTVDIASRNTVLANAVRRNLQNLVGTATSQTGIKRWVISPKMETPVLDFSNQEFITSTTILTQSRADLELKTFIPTHTPPTASGFGRGMWSGYGEIPTDEKGIFLELRESYPRQLIRVLDPFTRQLVETNTGSLLQACGFQQTNDKLSKRIGEIADTREISEAIVIIPYLDAASTGKTIRFGGEFSTLTVNDTVEIEGHNFIKINQNIFNYQKTNVLANKPAVDLTDFSVGNTKIQETSISRMLELMSKYVLPPNFDFLLNNDVTPFVMYIAEFTSTLDKQDLADIWQGVMPKIATRAEWEKQVISHKNTQFDFFHGQGLPEDVKFMIFKAKKRAEINYYKMTADSSDDGLFPSIQAGKPPSPYSFNWPYDYCSLVETARVDVEIEYINKSGSNNT